jgi:hypothetical protein
MRSNSGVPSVLDEAEKDFVGARSLDLVRSLNPRLETFRGWLDAHKEQLRPA